MSKKYFKRGIKDTVLAYLKIFPMVGILGSRQCGKSTFVKHLLGKDDRFAYFDLENYEDREKVAVDPLAFFSSQSEKIVCLDEIQRLPGIFQTLRGVIDKQRENGKFLVLGSASPQLIKQTSESLAGRIGLIEMTPFHILEIEDGDVLRHWVRGGFPESYLATDDEASFLWRDAYIKTIVERDIQMFRRIESVRVMKLLFFLSHYHGQVENFAEISNDFSRGEKTIQSYVDTLEAMYLVRRLRSYHTNTKKRLVKKAKLYIRDSGVLHLLSRIKNYGELAAHPIRGMSFEGYVIENIASAFPSCEVSFYRSSDGDEIDLIVQNGKTVVAVEIKTSKTPQLTKSNIAALHDIHPAHTCIVVPSYEEVFISQQSYGDLTIGSLPQIIAVLKGILS